MEAIILILLITLLALAGFYVVGLQTNDEVNGVGGSAGDATDSPTEAADEPDDGPPEPQALQDFSSDPMIAVEAYSFQ